MTGRAPFLCGSDLGQSAVELRKKRQEQQEQERKEYRDLKAQDTPTRPEAPLKWG
jgi:hypothetical protein